MFDTSFSSQRNLVTVSGLTVTLAALTACASNTKSTVRQLVIQGEYQEAVQLSGEQLERSPDDPELQTRHDRAKAAYLLEMGRRLTFEDRDEEALEAFGQATDLAPDSFQARSWYEKTLLKLGESSYIFARERHAEERLIEAMEAYQVSLSYNPDLVSARDGLARVFRQMNHRDGLAEDYYNEGVRSLREDEHWISRSRFDYSTKYRPGDERAARRRDQVEERLGRQRISSAASLEEEERFAAAEKEFSMALAFAPESEAAREGLRRCGIEARADRLYVLATQMILREEWDRARELLDEAVEVSGSRKDYFSGKIAEIDEARLNSQYEYSLDLEHDFRYADAIAAYGQILEERDFFLDVRARIDTLNEYIVRAGELYETAKAAPTPGQKVFFLLQIDLFWPEYLDLPEQLKDLEGVDPEIPEEDEAEASPESESPAETTEQAEANSAEPPVEVPADGKDESGQ